MKKLLILFALLCVAIQVMAADVSVSMARSNAQRFLASHAAKGSFNADAPTIKWVHQEMNPTRANKAAYYVVNTDLGFVVVAGDDRAQEILAYSSRPLDDMNSLPENMKFWLGCYKQQMEYLQAHPDLVVEKPSLKANRTESIEPMLVAMWNQGYPYYNQCPMDGDRRGQTGCAATSLAQVFYKWQYPTQPTPEIPGYTTRTRHFELPTLPSITFDWANMLPEYNFSATETQRNAVAWLMRYIGQAEQMDYTNEGSEAWEDDILRACHLFGYVGAHVEYKAKLNFDTNGEDMLISDADWSVMLQDELAAGRPVVYCAYSYSNAYNSFYGHAFNVDGYDATTGMYSINWGWGGTGNGYFALRAFNNQGYSYSLGELMVMGIEPPAPIEAYDPVMLPADSAYITLTSFRADWTDETPAENVTSYTLEVNTDDGSEPGVYALVMSESFPYASENGSRPVSKIDNYCTNKGWTGSNVYEARGGLRLGGGGSAGILTTPALDMTQSGGKMTVMLTMKPYQSADSDIPVTVSCGSSVQSAVVNAEQVYTFVLNCDADENQKVTITGGDGSNTKRVVVTQVDIYSATNDAAKMMLTIPAETGDSTSRVITDITDKFYTVNGLTAGGTFNYRVRAYYVNGTRSEWSNMQTVTLFDNGPVYQMGDVNHDGSVNIADVTTLIDYLLSDASAAPAEADVNEDGSINIADVTALIDLLLSKN
ncbi:MAG: C10 family peptidase [Muribaculaceae bacterium]|nr:C10 family peptidase [Muribaculaceae bacterium]